MADEKLTAATRLEKLLDNIAGGDNEVTPATRLEKFLSYIADAIEGGGGSAPTFKRYSIDFRASNDITIASGASLTIDLVDSCTARVYDFQTDTEAVWTAEQLQTEIFGHDVVIPYATSGSGSLDLVLQNACFNCGGEYAYESSYCSFYNPKSTAMGIATNGTVYYGRFLVFDISQEA